MNKISVKVKGIVECNGKYLLIQKWYDDNIVNPYKWEFVDCELEENKSPNDIVVDTVEHGFGIGVEESKILYTWSYTVGDVFHIGLAYYCKANSDIVLMSDEYSKFAWVEPDQFEKYIEDDKLIEDLKKHGIIKEHENDELYLDF
ncbi:MAG: hypothetical protein UF228_07435 [Lachnospiraceae bacterium]|nr:hypothetical protein [Lachnospiraceae bacterium]